MALNAARWAAAIAAEVSDDELEASEISQIDDFWLDVTTAHVAEITANARGNGTDSNGDSHGSMGII